MATIDVTEAAPAVPRPRKKRVLQDKPIATGTDAVFQALGMHACYEIETLTGVLLQAARCARPDLETLAKVTALRIAALNHVLQDVLGGEAQESSVELVEGISFEAFAAEQVARRASGQGGKA